MKIALLQTDIAWNDPPQNIKRCQALTKQALIEGANFLVLPEMFPCGFSMPDGESARLSQESGIRFLSETAVKEQVFTLGSLPEVSSAGLLYNCALLCTPDGRRESYRKIHLFSYGDETSHYSAGSAVLTTTVLDVRCTIFICYDLRFPLSFYHRAEQTDLFVVVANWPTPRREHWLTLLRARAIENQAFVAGINRVGEGGGLSYSGDSVVFGPDGTQLTELSPREGVITCDINPQRVADWRDTFPAIRDRRPEIYQTL